MNTATLQPCTRSAGNGVVASVARRLHRRLDRGVMVAVAAPPDQAQGRRDPATHPRQRRPRFIPVLVEKIDVPPYARNPAAPGRTDERHHDANLDTGLTGECCSSTLDASVATRRLHEIHARE
jgi:hypothetical protein